MRVGVIKSFKLALGVGARANAQSTSVVLHICVPVGEPVL